MSDPTTTSNNVLVRCWQVYQEGGSYADLTLDADFAIVLFDEPMGNG